MNGFSTILVIAAGLMQAASGPASRPATTQASRRLVPAIEAADKLLEKGGSVGDLGHSGLLSGRLEVVAEVRSFERADDGITVARCTVVAAELQVGRYYTPAEKKELMRLEETLRAAGAEYDRTMAEAGRRDSPYGRMMGEEAREFYEGRRKFVEDRRVALGKLARGRKTAWETVEIAVDVGFVGGEELEALGRMKKLRGSVVVGKIDALEWAERVPAERGEQESGEARERLDLPRRINRLEAKLVEPEKPWLPAGRK